MTLQQCKEQIAQEYEARLKEQIDGHPGLHHGGELPWSEEDVNDRISKLYACEKVKEALNLAANNATIWVETPINGTEFDELVDNLSPEGDPNPFIQVITVYKDRILSLETEIVNQINKEA